MLTPDSNPSLQAPPETSLTAIEVDTIDFFVRIAYLLGISKSIGEIYGLLFASPLPVPAEYVREKLRMSSGSASQGLRLLRTIGAVNVTYVAGERRDFYVAETGLRKIAAGVLREQIAPRLSGHEQRLAHLVELLDELPPSRRSLLEKRVQILHGWRRKAGAVLPILMQRLDEEEEQAPV